MGGSVGFTIRLASGKEYRQCRWTNAMPYYINNLKLIQEDRSHLRELIKRGEEMRRDYQKPKKHRKMEMSDVYGPDMGKLQPISYGLIVVDCKTHHILDMQGYSTLGGLTAYHPTLQDHDPERRDRIQALAEAGRLYRVPPWPCGDPLPELPLGQKGSTWEAICGIPEGFTNHVIDTRPFKVITFQETAAGATAFREKLLELGFKLTPAENRVWNRWIRENT